VEPPISVLVERGGLVESRHRVHAVAWSGREGAAGVSGKGEVDIVTLMRSAAKPFQALPVVLAAPDLTSEEVAIACASHDARPEQLEVVRALLARASVTEDDLECGPAEGSRLRHNCSGKHAAMLLLARRRGWRIRDYRLRRHPVQRELSAVVAKAAAISANRIPTATDGCGVVTYALPLVAMASMFARLVDGDFAGSDRVVAAMRAHPELVGGPTAVDTALMHARPGAIAKRGAEGLVCGALADGTGFAVKVEDGAGRAVGPGVASFLRVSALLEAPVFNSRGQQVGRILAVS
jgi:L-asparaginase II